MTDFEYSCFEIINAAAMKATTVNNDGSFVFGNDINTSKILIKEAKKNKIPVDDACAEDEFKIEYDNIVIYSDFKNFSTLFPSKLNAENLKRFHCFFSKEFNKLIILDCENLDEPKSFIFSQRNDLKINTENSMTNVFYWQKIYEVLSKDIGDEIQTDKSFCISSYEKGKCIFTYSNYDEKYSSINLKNTYEELKETINKTKLYPSLIKNRFVERLDFNDKSSLNNIISEIPAICKKVKIDFEIFISKIDFDSYIQKYKDKINDFISQTRSILEKMLSNIFMLPLTYAGSIFAFEKLDDKKFSIFIFVAMLIYTILSCGFLIYEIFDSFFIKKEFNKAMEFYTNNSATLKETNSVGEKSVMKRIITIIVLCIIMSLIFVALLIWLGFIFFGNNSDKC